MDPNETLRELREAVSDYRDPMRRSGVEYAAATVVEKFAALDAWLTQGGFLPDAWQRTLPETIHNMTPDELSDVRAYNAGRQAEATARYNAGQIGDDKPMSE
jgi:hypothetical protein